MTFAPAPAPQHLAAESAPEDVRVLEPETPADDAAGAAATMPAAEPANDVAPPLPVRRPKPVPVKTAEIVVKQETSPPQEASRDEMRREAAAPPSRWRPMALAPADKPERPKLSPSASKPGGGLSAAAHRSKVWSALARAKPRAGERGSATVTFSIGANGALRGARVAKSSGNAKLDRMALSTVRNAGPFPPPPGLKSGAASYTIRIDFH